MKPIYITNITAATARYITSSVKNGIASSIGIIEKVNKRRLLLSSKPI